MNIQKVKQGAKITWYNGIYMIILGIYYILFINFNMKLSFYETSELWGFFQRYHGEVAFLFYLFNIVVGFLMISNGIFMTYLSDFIIKRKEKITWVMLFVSGILSWGGLFLISILLKNWLLIILDGFGWVTFVLGMILPISYYLQKEYREY